ncbi:MAG: biotin/lipoyl-containing protein [Bacteroidota bacterium]
MPSFQATVGERTFDIVLEGDTLTVDGREVAFSFQPLGDNAYSLLLDGTSTTLVAERQPDGRLEITTPTTTRMVRVKDEAALLLDKFGIADASSLADKEVRAPMPGLVLRLLVEEGEEVQEGQGLLVLEAMKMENELKAPAAGTVASLHTSPGDAVTKGAVLVELV